MNAPRHIIRITLRGLAVLDFVVDRKYFDNVAFTMGAIATPQITPNHDHIITIQTDLVEK